MIVRILGEDQYEVPSSYLDRLNRLDNQAVLAAAEGDSKKFQRLLGQMLELVRKRGTRLGLEELHESDVILPFPDLTIEEAQGLFIGEGLIPG